MIPLSACFLATLAGILWWPPLLAWAWPLATLGLAGGVGLLLPLSSRRRRWLVLVTLVPPMMLLGAWRAASSQPHPQANDLYYYAPLPRSRIEGLVVGQPQLQADALTFTLQAQRMVGPQIAVVGGLVLVKVGRECAAQVRPGAAIRLAGRLRLPAPAGYPGAFSYRDYLGRKGIFTLIQSGSRCSIDTLAGRERPDPLARISAWRGRMLAALVPGLAAEQAALFGSLVLGDWASPMTDATRTEFRDVGLAAVLAASGMQVTLLLGLCLWLGARLRLPDRVLAPASAALLLLYALLTGFPPSIQRAAIVGLLALLGRCIGRGVQPLPALLLAGWLIVLASPGAAYDLGLILSLLATFGVLHTAPLIAARLSWLPGPVSQLAAMTLGAQLWVLPVQAYSFGTVSPYFLPANLGAWLLVEALTYSGLVTATIGLFVPVLAGWCNLVNGMLLSLLLAWVHLLAGLPGVRLAAPAPAWLSLVLLYPAILALLEARGRPAVRCLTATLLLASLWAGKGQPEPAVRITVTAAGQVSTTLLQISGYAPLLIGGEAAAARTSRPRLVPMLERIGINNLSLLPWPPAGRGCGGLPSLLTGSSVGQIWDAGAETEAPSYRLLWQTVLSKGIPASRLWPGEVLAYGHATRLELLSGPPGPLLLRLTTPGLRVLWAEGLQRGWSPPPGTDLAADWLITGARRPVPSLVAAARPGVIIAYAGGQLPAQPGGPRIVSPARDGPLIWQTQ